MRIKNFLELSLEYALNFGKHCLQALHNERQYHAFKGEGLDDGIYRYLILADESLSYRLHVHDQNGGVNLVHQREEVCKRFEHANFQLVKAYHKLGVVHLELF